MKEENCNKREHIEWCLLQQNKLRNEQSSFAGVLQAWGESLKDIEGERGEEDGDNLSERYKKMWEEAWKASHKMVSSAEIAKADNHEVVSWYLDKQLFLRRELEQYVKENLPAMYEALKPSSNSSSIYREAFLPLNQTWCDSWEESLRMVTC